MLRKEFDYGLRKYNKVFLTTLLLILLFYQGMQVKPAEESVLIAHSSDLRFDELPGVRFQDVSPDSPERVFREYGADAYLEGEAKHYILHLNPYSLRQTQVLMAVDSLRYEHTYKLVPLEPETASPALVQPLAVGFILSFLCLYLPVMAWKLEEDMLGSLIMSPADNRRILFSKQAAVGFLIAAAWLFYWFLFSPPPIRMLLLAGVSFNLMQWGMILGIWRKTRFGEIAFYLSFLLLLFAPALLERLGAQRTAPAGWLALSAAGLIALQYACIHSLHRYVRKERSA